MDQLKFIDLYKNSAKLSEKQSERRNQLLRNQKNQRNANVDGNRGISSLVKEIETQESNSHQSNLKHVFTQHKLQMSEWFIDRPEDISENWFIVPCPVGQRCLLIFTRNRAYLINKRGKCLFNFYVHPSKALHGTVLDCIHVKDTKQFYTLDILSYKNYDLINCDVDFRFFWIKNKIQDDNLPSFHEEYSIIPSTFFSVDELDNYLSSYPPFEDASWQLDGLLFFHKESHYIFGETPLVLWLNTFMVPELFNISMIHMIYKAQKPASYIDYKSHITEFNEKHKRPRRRSKHKHMEVEIAADESVELEDNSNQDLVNESAISNME